MRRPLASLVVLVALAVPAAGHASAPHARGGWLVGVAFGPARGRIDGADSLDTKWVDGTAQVMRIGRMLNPAIKLGYEHQAWLREQGLQDHKVRAGVQLEALAATAYFRQSERGSSALFVTLGTGYAHARLTLLEPLAPGESAIGNAYEEVAKRNESGWGWFGGLGWEYQVTRTFAASAMLSYNRVDIGGSAFDSAQFVPLVASLNWNF